jgi:hypothetical protein
MTTGSWSNGKTPERQSGGPGSIPGGSTAWRKVVGYGWPSRFTKPCPLTGMWVQIPCLPLRPDGEMDIMPRFYRGVSGSSPGRGAGQRTSSECGGALHATLRKSKDQRHQGCTSVPVGSRFDFWRGRLTPEPDRRTQAGMDRTRRVIRVWPCHPRSRCVAFRRRRCLELSSDLGAFGAWSAETSLTLKSA